MPFDPVDPVPARLPDPVIEERSSEVDDDDAWMEVRESWVGDAPAPQGVACIVGAEPAAVPDAPSPVRADLAQAALTALAAGDYEGAVMASETVLQADPGHADMQQCAQIARGELVRAYAARLGSMSLVVRFADAKLRETARRAGEPIAGIVVLVDGTATAAEVVARSEGPVHGTLKALSELYLRGWVLLD